MPVSFWKKYGPMTIPPDRNPHQTVTFSRCIWAVLVRCLVSESDGFAYSHIVPFVQEMSLVAKDDFSQIRFLGRSTDFENEIR